MVVRDDIDDNVTHLYDDALEYAREASRIAFEKGGGPTQKLQDVYNAYVENERRRKQI